MLTMLLQAFGVMLAIATLTWMISVAQRNAGIVDAVWSLMLLSAALVYAGHHGWSPAGVLVCVLVGLWAFRLSGHILIRNRGRGEDRRYADIRRRYSPGFAWKSLFLIFGFQAVVAWIISLPLALATGQPHVTHWSTGLAVILFVAGFLFESIADAQLARFRADPDNRGRVMDRGLWRYSRHPNYFGECLIWWGLWIMALPAGWWTVLSPLLLTWLLLRFSGVTLLEQGMSERRPGYRDYVARTNAFIPGPRRKSPGAEKTGTTS